jgi:hypothetical protein
MMGIVFSEFILKEKTKSIKPITCSILSQNIVVEKYQDIILFPWNSKRAADGISRFDCSAGSMCKTKHHLELNKTSPLLAGKCMHTSTGRNKSQSAQYFH